MYFGYKILNSARPKSITDFAKVPKGEMLLQGPSTDSCQTELRFLPSEHQQEGYPVTGTQMGLLPAGVSGHVLISF